jgi:abortive infection bacteriophage resistance protein
MTINAIWYIKRELPKDRNNLIFLLDKKIGNVLSYKLTVALTPLTQAHLQGSFIIGGVMVKPFRTHEEQISLLKSKGLIIKDESSALNILRSTNYYRLNAYFHQFLNDDTFLSGTTFETITEIYDVDRRLRRILSEHLEQIEIKTRCQVAYELAREFGPEIFYEYTNFKDFSQWEALQEALRKATTRDDIDPVADHYYSKYSGRFEIWVIVEYLSFGELSRLFGISHTRVQGEIAKSFGVHETLLKNWLEALSILRNVCAHYGYLRKRRFPIYCSIPKSHSLELGKIQELFSSILAICWLQPKEKRIELIDSIYNLPIQYEYYGFPFNWEKYLNI